MKQSIILLITVILLSCHSNSNTTSQSEIDSTSLITNFAEPIGKKINVSDVEMAKSLLNVDSARNVFENKIGKRIMFFPDTFKNYYLVNSHNNGLIGTIHECYSNHRPLVLTPDIIWLAICQGVSIHINEKIDSLKDILFIKNKPDKLIIRNDDLEYNANAWKSLINSFTDETKKYTKDDNYSFFVSKFTTTTEIDQTTYEITLLESYKKVFQYIAESGCGIPFITITGDKKDWELILSKIEMLDKLGLTNWKDNLKPIIKEFINVFEGKSNQDFWKSIYKDASEYGGYYISGWIIKFFPYIKINDENQVYDEKIGASRVGESFVPNKYLDGDKYLLSTLSTDNLPSGMAKIDVTWDNLFKGVTKKIEVYAGFFAIKQYQDKSLEPMISWAICEKDSIKVNHKTSGYKREELKHREEYWSPHICKKPTDSAVYDIKRFKTTKESIEFIKKMLSDSISNNSNVKIQESTKINIDFLILSSGKIAEINTDCKNKELDLYLKNILSKLPKEWFPALAHPQNVLALIDFPEEENKIKIRVNSEIKFELIVNE